ncbi:esterase/lipase family protein [Luteimonas sp. R10]|uniref:esterase/lipase family protein n=1 Tax=Luteimonas sp. R10 TaxID=3108176 RepID=UPI00308DB549|nr:alpha/beta fold hydrolase [Luteimonas sp. R10]
MSMIAIVRGCLAALLALAAAPAWSVCRDAVVLVHGNAGSPSHFDATRQALLARGYDAADIHRPDWGSKICAACNDHHGSEEAPVLDAMIDAIAGSCTGRIDVIGHSMGATLAAQQIAEHGLRPYVDAFVGVAGAFRGLWSCGTYPFNVATSTCGAWGLSVSSPFLDALYGVRFGDRVYSIKSYYDAVVCYGAICTVNGIHSSSIWGENASYNYPYGHFGLLDQTASRQANLIE